MQVARQLKESICCCRVGGWVGGDGPSDFIVNQSPNP